MRYYTKVFNSIFSYDIVGKMNKWFSENSNIQIVNISYDRNFNNAVVTYYKIKQ